MLEIKNLTKVYKSKKGKNQTALDNVSIDFDEKGFVCILGKSGSGKSTLLNLIGGLDAPTDGDIVVNGETISTFDNKKFSFYRSGYIGFVFQDFNILDDLNVFENVSISLELEKADSEYIKDNVLRVLTSLGMGEYAYRLPSELSGGQIQRVAIARALVKDPEIILADEPTGNLDSESSKDVMDLLREQSKSKLVIMVTHDKETAEKYADRIIELKDGNVLSDYVNYVDKSLTEMMDVDIEETVIEKQPITENSIELSNSKFEVKKSRLPNLTALKIGLKNITISKFRLLFTLILFSFTLVLFGFTVIVSNYDPDYSTAKSFEKSSIEHFEIEYCSEELFLDNIIDCLSSTIPDYFNSSRLSDLYDNENIKIYPKASMTMRILPGTYDPFTKSYLYHRKKYEYEPVNFNDYTAINHTSHFDIIAGEFPQAPNEVVISDFLAEYLTTKLLYVKKYSVVNISDLVGKKILTNKPNLELKISGVFKTDYKKYSDLFTISIDDSMKRAQRDRMKEFTIKRDSLYTTMLVNSDNYINPLNVEITGLINSEVSKKRFNLINYKKYVEYFNEDQLYPYEVSNLHSNEVVVKASNLYKYFDFTDRDLMFVKNNLSLLDEFIGETITIYPNQSKELQLEEKVDLKIVGIILDNYLIGEPITIQGQSEHEIEIMVSQDIIDKTSYNDKYYKGLIAYNYGSDVDNTNFLKQLKEKNFIHKTDISLVLYTYTKTSEKILPILLLVNAGLAVFTIILINSFTSFSITSKKKEIGILMAIGTKSKDVSKIFIFQSLIIGIISAVFAVISLYYLADIFNNAVSQDLALQLYIFNTGFTEILFVFLLSTMIVVLSSLFTTKLVTKKHPIDAIKDR